MTARKPSRCAFCGELLTTAPRGHGKRFCGTACRVAAYRRRRQRLPESTPRWERARGRLRLSGLAAFEERLAREAAWRADRDERRRQDEERAARRARLAARHDGVVARPPLPDDWMHRR